MKKNILVGGVAVACTLIWASAAAQQASFPDFQVTESVVSGATANVFTADKITGSYSAVITFTGNTFTLSGLWNAGQFVGNDGATPVASQLGQTGSTIANQYGMYAIYSASGTFTQNTNSTVTLNYAPGGNFLLILDPGTNTTFQQPANGSTAWTTSNNGDDVLIGTGIPASGQGTLDQTLATCIGSGTGINCGSFGSTSSFALTAVGSQFFSAPNPYYNISFQSGQWNLFSPAGTQVINGSMDMVFGPASVVTTPQVQFASFSSSLALIYARNGAQFTSNSSITLAPTAQAFNPATDVVSLRIGTATVSIPANSFRPTGTGAFAFSGVVNGVTVNATLQPQGANAYRLVANGSPLAVGSVVNPVPVAVRIGNNTGTAAVAAQIVGNPVLR
jgi:hypothetical protein